MTPKFGDLNPLCFGLPWWLIPGLGESHMSQSNEAYAQLLSLCSRAQELQRLKSVHPKALAAQQVMPLQWETCAPQLEDSHILSTTRAKPMQQQRLSTAKNKETKKKF